MKNRMLRFPFSRTMLGRSVRTAIHSDTQLLLRLSFTTNKTTITLDDRLKINKFAYLQILTWNFYYARKIKIMAFSGDLRFEDICCRPV